MDCKKNIISIIALIFLCLPARNSAEAQHGTPDSNAPTDPWEAAMLEFEERDRSNSYPPESIFFTGSSSIRLWSTLAYDMAPYPVIQRGFGGSRMADVLRLSDRYIAHHSFLAMVLFVANDITGSLYDIRPVEVRNQFEEFIGKMRSINSETPIFIIAITPTRSRWSVWDLNQSVNYKLAGLADNHHNVIFVPTEDLFLGEDGLPVESLFVDDQLHLSVDGYTLWTKRLRSYMDPVLSGR